MIRSLLTLALCGGAVALAACSSDVGERYPDVNAFCTAKAEAECNGIAAQCGATLDTCKQKLIPTCTADANTATTQGRRYNAAAAPACVDKTNALYGAKTIDPKKEAEQNDTCARVFAGQKAKNSPCTTAYECQGSMICDKGVCSDLVVKNQGEACNNPGEVCAAGSFCGQQGELKFCLPKKQKGELCTAELPCVETLYCLGSCKDKIAPGEACGSDDECSATAPYCDPAGQRCTAKSYAAGSPTCQEVGGI